MDAREARVTNRALKRRLLEGQMKDNYTMEVDRLRSEMHNPRIPEASIEFFQQRDSAGAIEHLAASMMLSLDSRLCSLQHSTRLKLGLIRG